MLTMGESRKMDEEKKELTQEKEDCNPLTDEEFKEYLKEEQRKEKKVKRIFSAIWEAINFFS